VKARTSAKVDGRTVLYEPADGLPRVAACASDYYLHRYLLLPPQMAALATDQISGALASTSVSRMHCTPDRSAPSEQGRDLRSAGKRKRSSAPTWNTTWRWRNVPSLT